MRPTSQKEVNGFLSSLRALSTKPAILSLIELYSSKYVPKSLSEDFPVCLSSLLESDYIKYSYGDLLEVAKKYKISVTPQQAEVVERETLSQSKSPLWYRMRSGRIRASLLKRACHTDTASPSISLIMTIMSS